jgi:hypothetical protein
MTITLPKRTHYVPGVVGGQFARLHPGRMFAVRNAANGYPAIVSLTEIRDRLKPTSTPDEGKIRECLRMNSRFRLTIMHATGGAAVRPLLSSYQTATVAQHLITGSGVRLVCTRVVVTTA